MVSVRMITAIALMGILAMTANFGVGQDTKAKEGDDKPTTDKPTTDKPTTDKPAADKEADKKPQDKPAEKPADKPSGDKAASDESFETLFAELKKLVADLNDIRVKYATAKEGDRPKLEAEYKQKIERGQVIYPKLLPAAEKAFAAKPDMTADSAKHLLESIERSMAEGNAKEAARILNVLTTHVSGNADLGVLALNMGNSKVAMDQLSKAAQAGRLATMAEKALAEAKIREAEAKADDLPRVKLETSKGDIVIELFENEAPNTVANYISLIEKKFYDGLIFHRVIGGFMAQGGDPTGTGGGGPGYSVACECYAENHRNHFRGSLSMAHAGKDTGGSQFFLCFMPTAHLDGKHTVFGRIIEGLDVLDKLQKTEPEEVAGKPDKIVKATIVRKREHEYKPKTLPDAKGK